MTPEQEKKDAWPAPAPGDGKKIYLMEKQQQRIWCRPAILFILLAVALAIVCASWRVWFEGPRMVDGKKAYVSVSGYKICRHFNVTDEDICENYQEFGDMPTAVVIFWFAFTYFLLCCLTALGLILWFIFKSDNPVHLRAADWAVRLSGLTLIPIIVVRYWWVPDFFLDSTWQQSGGFMCMYFAISIMWMAYLFTSCTTRRRELGPEDNVDTGMNAVSRTCDHQNFPASKLKNKTRAGTADAGSYVKFDLGSKTNVSEEESTTSQVPNKPWQTRFAQLIGWSYRSPDGSATGESQDHSPQRLQRGLGTVAPYLKETALMRHSFQAYGSKKLPSRQRSSFGQDFPANRTSITLMQLEQRRRISLQKNYNAACVSLEIIQTFASDPSLA